MNLYNELRGVVCVYKLINVYNNKILIGSTKDLYNRICHYRADINKKNPLKYYNREFYNDLIKYGHVGFDVETIEVFDKNISDIDLKNKESYYIKFYNSTDKNVGYNIRLDINGKYIISNSTREIKRRQTKEQWANGIRDGHSDKLKEYWNNNIKRKEQQSIVMTEALTKYVYNIYDLNNNILYKNIGYKKLKELNYISATDAIHRQLKKRPLMLFGKPIEIKNSIRVKTKDVFVERIKVND